MGKTTYGGHRRSRWREIDNEASGESSREKQVERDRGKRREARRERHVVCGCGGVCHVGLLSQSFEVEEPKEPRSRRIRSHDIPDT